MKHLLAIILITLPLIAGAQTVKDLQQEQQKLQQEIKETDRMLSQTKNDKKSTQNKLNLINRDIKNRKKIISSINTEITILNRDIASLTSKRQKLQTELEDHKLEYARMVRETHYADIQHAPLLFLLSADNFQQLMRRIRYMYEFQQYRKAAVQRIQGIQTDIDIQNNLLEERKQDKNTALQVQKTEQDKLARNERQQQKMLKDLKQQESTLTAQLKKQQKKADEINRKIENMIRQQTQSKTTLTKEQQLIAGGFERNKGLLPWPVEKGFISGFFGTHQHPVYEHVTINNKGIYLQTVAGAAARAVYEGEVSGILVLGSTYAVIVQHGNYRTVYSNLKDILVKQGDKIKTKQNLGHIATDTENDNKTELFFQIYMDRNLQDPTPWLAK
ncbi:MAG: peptidoglycan DD-metalloendopeptidase family protein [Paludibacteraceae bacterium]|nr:peptidoglycan DD-metalloendopeptidase family protein [Paludibacteraceae bacterium]